MHVEFKQAMNTCLLQDGQSCGQLSDSHAAEQELGTGAAHGSVSCKREAATEIAVWRHATKPQGYSCAMGLANAMTADGACARNESKNADLKYKGPGYSM